MILPRRHTTELHTERETHIIVLVASTMSVQSLTRERHFKEQLLEFVEERVEPFDLEFLASNCNDRFVDHGWVQGALWELEEDGRIVRLNRHYLSSWVLMRRWIRERIPTHEAELKPLNEMLPIPDDLMGQIRELLSERPELGYLDVDEFARDAIRKRIQQHKKDSHRGSKCGYYDR